MDRQLAQRMVGAACLLAVLVLIVPAILDGNLDSDAVITHPAVDDSLDLRTHTIRLDGEERAPPVPTPLQSAADVEPAPPQPAPLKLPVEAGSDLAEPESPAPKPVDKSAVAESPISAEAAREPVRELSREPVPVAKAEAKPAAGGAWIVQLGSFSQRGNADRLAADVEKKGFGVSVESGGGTSGSLFRVRVGPVADRAAAEKLAGRLAAAGFKGGRVGQQ